MAVFYEDEVRRRREKWGLGLAIVRGNGLRGKVALGKDGHEIWHNSSLHWRGRME